MPRWSIIPTGLVTKATFVRLTLAGHDNRLCPSSMPVKIFCAFSNWQPRAIWIRKELHPDDDGRTKEGRKAERGRLSLPPLLLVMLCSYQRMPRQRLDRLTAWLSSWLHHHPSDQPMHVCIKRPLSPLRFCKIFL